MKNKFLLILASLLAVLSVFYITNELLTTDFKWWTIPILCIVWILAAMGIIVLFDVNTDTDNSKGEEDRRTGRSDEWPEEAEQ
jgi:hypothetical protein